MWKRVETAGLGSSALNRTRYASSVFGAQFPFFLTLVKCFEVQAVRYGWDSELHDRLLIIN